jgi:hypothetical protein
MKRLGEGCRKDWDVSRLWNSAGNAEWWSVAMEIRLSPVPEAAVERGVATGWYGSVEEYVAAAVELLQEREELGEAPEEFHAKAGGVPCKDGGFDRRG